MNRRTFLQRSTAALPLLALPTPLYAAIKAPTAALGPCSTSPRTILEALKYTYGTKRLERLMVQKHDTWRLFATTDGHIPPKGSS